MKNLAAHQKIAAFLEYLWLGAMRDMRIFAADELRMTS